ncbi:MAG: DNA translocase FtsK 4TM domain-containing protein [Sulfurimonas sp.]|uniref:FtsK/SpoIIIE family DNA translocase n=1 Tax=Sulfurimonas sp. TaxID=2022749 RepID=UPI0025DF1AFE|nr:DNA translocase FtsK 4TM domain-containing protein [Sulfurimonas sp.]MCK9490477.1 DNA translocase FtsK 4TM domain-containing protein [Sulfurimonas sp.]
MKETLFIITFGILIYLGFATIFGDSGLIGSYGSIFASYNQKYFGYVSFIYILALLFPLYYFYRDTAYSLRKIELVLASFLMFSSLLLAQAILVLDELRGIAGGEFVDFLAPFIGLFGLWVFWFIITCVSALMFLDKSIYEIASSISKMFKREKKVVIKDTKESISESDYSIYDEPSYTRSNFDKKTDEVKENIIEEAQKEDIALEEVQKEIKEKELENTPQNILEVAAKIKEKKNALVVDELEENKKLLEAMERGEVEKPKNFILPSVEFLKKVETKTHCIDENEIDDKIRYLIEKLAHFKIDGDVVRTYAGPVVSTFEFKPAANVKVSKILNLQDDLAMALSAETIRIQAPIPGKDVVGIEIPNETVETIYIRELLDSKLFKESASPLTIALGKDIVGKPFITDLKKLPHLLIAGTTGSGKSVGINAMILSLLYKNSPDQLRLLMIDPKMLEFSIYNGIPHLLTPVITKAKQAIVALNNMVSEMERRYELMSETRTKNIENYNDKVKKVGGEHLPYIVVIIDELADLMMTSGKDVEHSIARLAQMARASGIHLIVATQRPSVDVVTGLIKANLPSRISYRVGQKVDSKIILDQMGAESLLGRGDMLFTPPGSTGLVRLHAPWTSEGEIEKIVDFIKSQREANYDKSFLVEDDDSEAGSRGETYEELDPLYEDAKSVVMTDRKTSISYLQRRLQVGYNRSARIVEQLEGEGVLSSPNTKGVREIL